MTVYAFLSIVLLIGYYFVVKSQVTYLTNQLQHEVSIDQKGVLLDLVLMIFFYIDDFEQLLGSLQVLENDARKCGLLSISGTSPGESQSHPTRDLATRTTETAQLVDTFYQEKNRLLMNIRAAATAATSSIGGPQM